MLGTLDSDVVAIAIRRPIASNSGCTSGAPVCIEDVVCRQILAARVDGGHVSEHAGECVRV